MRTILRSALVFALIIGLAALPALAQPDLTFDTLSEFNRYLEQIHSAETPEDANALVEAMWDTLLSREQIPLVFPGGEVVFMYRGQAETVDWRGDASGWQSEPHLVGARVGLSDLWVMQTVIPRNARIEYKIVLNGDIWMLDPANPHVVASGFGPNSEIRMPDFTSTLVTDALPDVARGTVSEPFLIESEQMGYTLSYWVYTPVGYETLDNLTTFYVLDGNDYVAEMKGRMPHALDNLIADARIEPVVVVFINARDPYHPENNRRETEYLENDAYANFVADELVPAIEAAYRVNPSIDARVIVGTSYSGLGAAYITAFRYDTFRRAALFSPAFWASEKLDLLPLDRLGGGDIFMSSGGPTWDVGDLTETAGGMRALGFNVLYITTPEGHSWETWRALLDEMLEFFVGTA